MRNHTPGPWRHIPDRCNRDDHHHGSIVAPEDRVYDGVWYIATMEDAPEVEA